MRTYYIYKATNRINGKIYIGQTVDPKSRIWQHWRCYDKEKCNFHDAIQEFGFENFEWEIIDSCNNIEDAENLEKHYIEEYDSFRDGYNMTKGGKGASMWNARPIVRLDLKGNYIKRYDSAGETKADGFWDADVLLNCKNKTRTCKGFLFMFEDEYLENGPKELREKKLKTTPVIQCDLCGNFIRKFDSVKEASEVAGVQRTTLSSNLTGNYKSAGGYIFVYENDFPIKNLEKYFHKKKGRKVAQVNPQTNEIIEVFERIADAGRKLNVNYKAIHKVIDMDDRTAYGYKWISQ